MRIHPAIIAQAAATAAAMMPGRFRLGLGAGENLNEHIIGEHWPQAGIRHDMLEESIEIIRELWKGDEVNYYGSYFTCEEAKLFTTPPEAPPIYVAASGPQAAVLAAQNDGLITTSPDREVIQSFEQNGGRGKPRFGQITVCWAENEAEARKIAHEWWPTSGIPGNATWETKTVELFDQLSSAVTEEQVAKSIICGPDPQKHIEQAKKYIDAGFDHVYFHQVGPNQEGFFRFYEREVLPQLSRKAGASAAG
jgi:G6PDH family F420-dependent oxidoreductase